MDTDDHQSPRPVNAYSNVVDPRQLFPAHFDALMRSLFERGEQPERWRVLDAAESRLDEVGHEVEFTLVQHGSSLVWRCRVLLCHGQLARISSL